MYRTVTDIALPITLALIFIGAGFGLMVSERQPSSPAPPAAVPSAAR